jgi:hypothetical protein
MKFNMILYTSRFGDLDKMNYLQIARKYHLTASVCSDNIIYTVRNGNWSLKIEQWKKQTYFAERQRTLRRSSPHENANTLKFLKWNKPYTIVQGSIWSTNFVGETSTLVDEASSQKRLKQDFNIRVWSWLRTNAGGVLNTCKSNGNSGVFIWSYFSGGRVSNTWVTCPMEGDNT